MIIALAKFTSQHLLVDASASSSVEPTSPRSVDACLQLGIEPCELKFIPQHHFLKNLGDADLAELAFKHHENTRQVCSASRIGLASMTGCGKSSFSLE